MHFAFEFEPVALKASQSNSRMLQLTVNFSIQLNVNIISMSRVDYMAYLLIFLSKTIELP